LAHQIDPIWAAWPVIGIQAVGADIDCISIETLAAQIRVVCAPRGGSDKRSLATGAARCAQAIREYRKAPMCGHPGFGI